MQARTQSVKARWHRPGRRQWALLSVSSGSNIGTGWAASTLRAVAYLPTRGGSHQEERVKRVGPCRFLGAGRVAACDKPVQMRRRDRPGFTLGPETLRTTSNEPWREPWDVLGRRLSRSNQRPQRRSQAPSLSTKRESRHATPSFDTLGTPPHSRNVAGGSPTKNSSVSSFQRWLRHSLPSSGTALSEAGPM